MWRKGNWENTPKLTVMGGGRGAGAGMKGEQFCKTHTFLKLGTSNLFFCVTRILFKIYSYMYRYMIDVFWEVFSGARNGVGGGVHRFPSVRFGFSSLLSFLTMNTPPPAVSGDRPYARRQGSRLPAFHCGPAGRSGWKE